jgi:hypothetical protein
MARLPHLDDAELHAQSHYGGGLLRGLLFWRSNMMALAYPQCYSTAQYSTPTLTYSSTVDPVTVHLETNHAVNATHPQSDKMNGSQ